VELQRVLPGISTEQLRSRLNRMVADDLLTRQRYREVPPRVDYELTERARDLLPVIGALARWGYRWTWGPPEPGEAIDIGAVLRCIPGFAPPEDVTGVVELTVRRPNGDLKRYVLSPEAGNERAWVDALGPAATSDELVVSGDEHLAESLLSALSSIAGRAAAVA
jgi:hypothetical protein